MNRTKYRQCLDLSAPGLVAALHDGLLTLQPGQWVKFDGSFKSRFIGATPRTIWALHSEHAGDAALVSRMARRFKSTHN